MREMRLRARRRSSAEKEDQENQSDRNNSSPNEFAIENGLLRAVFPVEPAHLRRSDSKVRGQRESTKVVRRWIDPGVRE